MDIAETVKQQSGVVARRQLLARGASDDDIARRLRRQSLVRIHHGVYVNHTGPLTWEQRAWAAVLVHWPAALAGRSALRAYSKIGPTSSNGAIEIVIAGHRRVVDPEGVSTSRIKDYDGTVLTNLSPPRVRYEHAVLVMASRARTEDAAVATLSEACQGRRSTPDRLVEQLRLMTRLPRRRLLLEILEDVAAGTYSALERRYLVDVERPHGLPTATRQRRVRPGKAVTYRDVDYVDLLTTVELDGRLGHESAQDRWADLERDLDTAVAGGLTLRAGWKQVLDPCRLAAVVGRVLAARGWDGAPYPCGPDCVLTDGGGTPAPGAEIPPLSA